MIAPGISNMPLVTPFLIDGFNFRPFVIQPVVSSNMVLLVINNICPQIEDISLPHIPAQVDYNMTFECYRVFNNSYTRRHYMSCINRSSLVSKMYLLNAIVEYVYSIFRNQKSSYVEEGPLYHHLYF